jgi:hypothetical protein
MTYDELLLNLNGATFLHDRQEEIDRLIALCDIQHQATKLITQPPNSMPQSLPCTMLGLGHLAQKQAIEMLNVKSQHVNIACFDSLQRMSMSMSMNKSQIESKIEENVVKQILHSQHAICYIMLCECK